MNVFRNDYSTGAHPAVMLALQKTNDDITQGYGEDDHCTRASDLLRKDAQAPDCAIYFFTGGTQANLTLIAHALRPFEAVISAETGHIATHETGAIESTGHKVLAAPAINGKLTVESIQSVLQQNSMPPHMVRPAMVYISQPTELGTLYTLQELNGIRDLCNKRGLFLYLDGARMACALAAQAGEIGLPEYASLCDAFTVGGTKCGALLGEAMMIPNQTIADAFRYSIKQRGAMLAKGRLLGIQFCALLEENLYLNIGLHANRMAARLRKGLADLGVPFFIESHTNQQFPIFSKQIVQELEIQFGVMPWDTVQQGIAVRCVTSWSTQEPEVDALICAYKNLLETSR